MNQIKSGLTRLKSRVSEKVTEEQDVLGFPGVTKAGILSLIDRSYGLVARLEALRGTFAIVVLKRKLTPVLESCKSALDTATGDEVDKEKFDEFLTALTGIHDDIYMTYHVYGSDGINVEADISVVADSVAELSERVEGLRPKIDEVAESLESIQELSSRSEEIVDSQEKTRDQGSNFIAEIEKAKTSALASAEILSKYENNAKNEQDTINSLARKAAKTDQHIKQVIGEVTEKMKLIESALGKAESAAAENDKQQQDIAKTLEAASKYGMAASFKGKHSSNPVLPPMN